MMKLFVVDFEPVYPVGCGLVILAENQEEAAVIASNTILHDSIFSLEEVFMDESRVVFYDDGDY